MGKTALQLTVEELRQYQPNRNPPKRSGTERWEQAWKVARLAAHRLREVFGARRVVAFGSLAHRDWFSAWSDIDLAAWGIPDDEFYRAVASVTGLSADFEIDLVDAESCRPALRRVIEREGVDL